MGEERGGGRRTKMKTYMKWAAASLAAGMLLFAGCGAQKAAGSASDNVSVTMKPEQLTQVAAADSARPHHHVAAGR